MLILRGGGSTRWVCRVGLPWEVCSGPRHSLRGPKPLFTPPTALFLLIANHSQLRTPQEVDKGQQLRGTTTTVPKNGVGGAGGGAGSGMMPQEWFESFTALWGWSWVGQSDRWGWRWILWVYAEVVEVDSMDLC